MSPPATWRLPPAMRLVLPFVAAALVAVSFWYYYSPAQAQKRTTRALLAACKEGSTVAAKNALSLGADVNTRDRTGITPLMYAARGTHPNMSDPNATDHADLVELLLDNHADPNAATKTGFVALLWAARYGHARTVKALIDHGADVHAKDRDGITPMKMATANQTAAPAAYAEVLALLKQAGETE